MQKDYKKPKDGSNYSQQLSDRKQTNLMIKTQDFENLPEQQLLINLVNSGGHLKNSFLKFNWTKILNKRRSQVLS